MFLKWGCTYVKWNIYMSQMMNNKFWQNLRFQISFKCLNVHAEASKNKN